MLSPSMASRVGKLSTPRLTARAKSSFAAATAARPAERADHAVRVQAGRLGERAIGGRFGQAQAVHVEGLPATR